MISVLVFLLVFHLHTAFVAHLLKIISRSSCLFSYYLLTLTLLVIIIFFFLFHIYKFRKKTEGRRRVIIIFQLDNLEGWFMKYFFLDWYIVNDVWIIYILLCYLYFIYYKSNDVVVQYFILFFKKTSNDFTP
jgi:hypothetical protein